MLKGAKHICWKGLCYYLDRGSHYTVRVRSGKLATVFIRRGGGRLASKGVRCYTREQPQLFLTEVVNGFTLWGNK